MHLGHQAVIRRAVERAGALGVPAVALTFDPLPMAVLRPAEAPPEILPLEERLEAIASLGPAVAFVIQFTPEFSRVEAEPFVRDVLVGLVRAREVVVGFNHTFGRGARGTPELLGAAAAPFGIAVHVVEPSRVDGVVVSSTAVRDVLRQGDVERAAALLGRPYAIRGRVMRGAERGRTLGFPTANLAPTGAVLLASGVYAARARWDGDSAAAVVNVGVRPTFGESALVIEAHLLDVSVDLYDRPLALTFLARIRDEMKFPSLEALRTRIDQDVALARRVLA
jgi:riboflavin kinase/FMN adenylyltransferase